MKSIGINKPLTSDQLTTAQYNKAVRVTDDQGHRLMANGTVSPLVQRRTITDKLIGLLNDIWQSVTGSEMREPNVIDDIDKQKMDLITRQENTSSSQKRHIPDPNIKQNTHFDEMDENPFKDTLNP